MQNDVEQPGVVDLDPVPGFKTLIGHRLVGWSDGAATMVLNVDHRHLNRSGVVHGGVLATMLDAAAGYTGLYCAAPGRVRRARSISFSLVFVAAARPPVVQVSARRIGGGRSIYFACAEAFDETNALLATAQASYRYVPGSENPEGVPLESATGGVDAQP